MSRDTLSSSSSFIVDWKYWILINLFRKLLFNMSESDILPEGLAVNMAAAEIEETVTQSTSGYPEDEDAELHMAIKMSLEEPGAETTETIEDNIDKEEQVELDQALFLSSLPPNILDEQLAELHQARVNKAISGVMHQAVRLAPDGSDLKVEELHSSAVQLMEHFQQSGDWTATNDAIQLMEEVIKLTPNGHSQKAERLSNLGNAFHNRFEHLGKLGDIENALLVYQQAVDLTPDGHAHKAAQLNNLSTAFQSRFQHLGKLGDIENAILANQQAVDLTPDGHTYKATLLTNLGNAIQMRFECLGELGDIENAILVKQQALDLTPNGHAHKAAQLNNLSAAFQSRFQRLGKLGDIENAILANQQAVDLTPDWHADKAGWLTNLGNAFQMQFECLGELTDVENAILVKQQAVDLTPDGHAQKAAQLNNLGIAFQSRFKHLGELRDIENAILVMQQAVDLTPDWHADKAGWLTNLGNAFQMRFECLGELTDVKNAILVKQQAVDLMPDGHAEKAAQLNNLGNAFICRFEHLGELGDIENAIRVNQQAVDLTPDGHAHKATQLNNLGNAFSSRFEHLGELRDIENAISLIQQAVDLTPDGHADKAARLSNLGNAFLRQFKHLGKLSDIENAIFLKQQAVDQTPDGHAYKAAQLSSLGTTFVCRFEHLGELGDIENAILLIQQAVDLTPDGHADKAARLNNLGNAFFRRFERLGELRDIENAIFVIQQAVDQTPDGYAHKAGHLNNLGITYVRRFEHLGELGDMENAILVNQQAVDLTPDGHANKAAWLNSLGLAFFCRFKRLGELRDIENVILINQQAVDLTPDGHAHKATLLSNLSSAFQSRFKHLGKLEDIENAILATRQAVDLTPDGHAAKATWLNNLGNAFSLRFQHFKELGDIMEATVAYKQATENTSSRPFTRYYAACRWATLCSEHQSPFLALDAYTVVLELIPQVVWFGQTVHHRYEELPEIGRTINAAAAMAISVGDLPRAVEWLEEGRSIVWKQILQLRTPLDELHQQDPNIANELSWVSLALDKAGTSRLQNIDWEIKHSSAEEEAQNHRRLAAQYEKLLQEVRELDGFGSFLRPKKFSELVLAARNGPVVVVNVAELRCDALVLCTSGEIVPVPLPTFSYKQAETLRLNLLSSLQAHGVRVNRNGDRATHLAGKDNQDHFISVLADLWSHVVQPILSEIEQALYENAHHSLPHITWCATGALAFLPLHAAGIYGDPTNLKNMNTSDFAVSSYTTTLTTMLVSGSKPRQDLTKTPSVLIVSQPGTPKLPPLPGTVKEVEVIQHYASLDHTCHLTHESATVEAVLAEMSKHEIIHLACHGIQDMKNPLSSAFALYDGRLELNTLMKLSLKNAELAVLSACQTATGNENLPEEAVHLAAGMLAVGYPSVIGTMWSIGDKDAPLIADKVYANLLGCCDNTEIQKVKLTPAYALHEAVKHLRGEVGETKFVKWVPFIHFGV
ncbi:TPR-like protein [Dendrothele bispora CBS 962.96]|uniref:TPR-like protein n=1 Tax=Dendrothele bispora (strain CBS 962.96) TaxID=1314807 RepID=A0A4S8KXI5_DENBC|nr:TPR-like protein [Dendrothele bispora CBS 962.96]